MTIMITLPPTEEARLQEEAAAQGQDMDAYAHALLAERLRSTGPQAAYDPGAALALLDSFLEQDEAEHKETLAVLRHAIDGDRPGQRSVFGQGINPSKQNQP